MMKMCIVVGSVGQRILSEVEKALDVSLMGFGWDLMCGR